MSEHYSSRRQCFQKHLGYSPPASSLEDLDEKNEDVRVANVTSRGNSLRLHEPREGANMDRPMNARATTIRRERNDIPLAGAGLLHTFPLPRGALAFLAGAGAGFSETTD